MTTSQAELDRIIARLKRQGAPPNLWQPRVPKPEPSPGSVRPERWVKNESTPSPSEIAYRVVVEAQRTGAGLLADPYASRYVYLDQPILIWQHPPDTSQLVATQIAPSNSWAKIFLYGEGSDARGGSFHTQLYFYYFWQNESLDPVVVSATTRLVMSGSCSATGSGGFWGGHKSGVSVSSILAVQRWIGWGVNPFNGAGLDHTFFPVEPSQVAAICGCEAKGSWGFGYRAFTSAQSVDFQPFDMRVSSLTIPGSASIMFPVVVYFYGSTEGDTLSDQVWAAFENQGVFSPYLLLTVHSPS